MKVQQWSAMTGVLALALTACGGAGTPTVPPMGNGTGGSVPGLSTPVVSPVISADEQAILDAVNLARTSARSCGGTIFAATTPLAWNARLAAAARLHSEDMALTGYRGSDADPEAAHIGSDGSTPQQRITQAGYVWRVSGENVAVGFAVGNVVAAWLSSPGHCSNIMKPEYKEMGVGYVVNAKTQYNTFFTQDFGSQ
ncbi:CAP domain-containing protein [Deinococcus radiomollis]|uniref:CAP domain-containing protein n=1 Tax=Deinococcus radiomollis TaxID=468916 RepID=UPI0038927623